MSKLRAATEPTEVGWFHIPDMTHLIDVCVPEFLPCGQRLWDQFLINSFTSPRLGALGLPLVLRALHKYHVAENERDAVEDSSIEERNACDAAQRLVSMLCERLCSAWGSSAVVAAANQLRYLV